MPSPPTRPDSLPVAPAADWTGRTPAGPGAPPERTGGKGGAGPSRSPSALARLERGLPPRVIGLSAAVMLVLGLLALVPDLTGQPEAISPPIEPSESQGGTTGRTTLDLAVGECFNAPTDLDEELGAEPDGAAVPALTVVPCEEPHAGEVYAVLLHPDAQGSPYPGQQQVLDFGTQTCVEAFPGFVGIPYEESVYQVYTFVPDERSWVAGLRTLNCSVAEMSGAPITGTARDTAR